MKTNETLEVWDYLTRNGLIVAIGDLARGRRAPCSWIGASMGASWCFSIS
jgi:hypothetical protein